jgi:hypothetical protein
MKKIKALKKAIGCLAVGIVVFGVVDAGLWLSDHTELALAVIVFGVAFVSFVAASAWSALLIRAGAEIGVRSQESDNKLDIAQAKVMVEMIKAVRQGQNQQPALPMPQQQDWLPRLSEFSEGEYEEVTREEVN